MYKKNKNKKLVIEADQSYDDIVEKRSIKSCKSFVIGYLY